jgi:hypothetical protein
VRRAGIVLLLAALLPLGGGAADEDASRFVQFVEEPGASCVTRNGMQILVKNTHATRSLRVWLDRYHMGVGTGDRSRSDLKPGEQPQPLGCSRSLTGTQEWRIVRAAFLD